jgi:hypothetical protein
MALSFQCSGLWCVDWHISFLYLTGSQRRASHAERVVTYVWKAGHAIWVASHRELWPFIVSGAKGKAQRIGNSWPREMVYERWKKRRARVVPEVEGYDRNMRCVKIVYLEGDFLLQGLSKCLPLNAREQALRLFMLLECNVIYLTDVIVWCLVFCCTHHESIWGWRYNTNHSSPKLSGRICADGNLVLLTGPIGPEKLLSRSCYPWWCS